MKARSMTYAYLRREPTMEELAALVISQAAVNAEAYASGGIAPNGYHRRTFPHMLARFARGDVLDARDDDCLAAVGQFLIDAVNVIAPGYANVVLNGDTSNDIYFSRELQSCRDLLVEWQEFHWQRNRLCSRVKARSLFVDP